MRLASHFRVSRCVSYIEHVMNRVTPLGGLEDCSICVVFCDLEDVFRRLVGSS